MNGENAADGVGLTAKLAEKILAAGADVITTGNHVWRHRDLVPLLESSPRIVRPANFGDTGIPGTGLAFAEARDGTEVAVINLQGALFLATPIHPFRMVDKLVEEARARTPVVLIDFHAEATSEKIALARMLDGRVTAVIGTHTHVQTNDARAARRDRGDHRRGHDRAARLRHRRPRRAGHPADEDRDAGAVPPGRRRRPHRGRRARLRRRRARYALRGAAGSGRRVASAATSATASATSSRFRTSTSQPTG